MSAGVGFSWCGWLCWSIRYKLKYINSFKSFSLGVLGLVDIVDLVELLVTNWSTSIHLYHCVRGCWTLLTWLTQWRTSYKLKYINSNKSLCQGVKCLLSGWHMVCTKVQDNEFLRWNTECKLKYIISIKSIFL